MANPDPYAEESKGVLISGKIMVASIILLFAVVVFVMLLHLYARWFWGHSSRRVRARRRRFVFTTEQDPVRVQRRGLEPAVIRSLPIFTFQAKSSDQEEDGGLECAVCLCEFEEGEKARLLPACRHNFHVDCIDMWFHSHSTCPLCRTVVVKNAEPILELQPLSQEVGIARLSLVADTPVADDDLEPAPPASGDEGFSFPTNVLFWGNQNRVDSGCSSVNCEEGTSSYNSHISIDIPPRGVGLNSSTGECLSTGRLAETDFGGLSPGGLSLKSPNTRMRMLRRLLSRDKRSVSTCSSPSGDVEQGVEVVRT